MSRPCQKKNPDERPKRDECSQLSHLMRVGRPKSAVVLRLLWSSNTFLHTPLRPPLLRFAAQPLEAKHP